MRGEGLATEGGHFAFDTRHLSRYSRPYDQELPHKELGRFFATGSTRGIDARLAPKLNRILAALNTATEPKQLDAPSWRLHPLHGDREGQWSVWVTGNWRLVFVFEDNDSVDVDLVDYH